MNGLKGPALDARLLSELSDDTEPFLLMLESLALEQEVDVHQVLERLRRLERQGLVRARWLGARSGTFRDRVTEGDYEQAIAAGSSFLRGELHQNRELGLWYELTESGRKYLRQGSEKQTGERWRLEDHPDSAEIVVYAESPDAARAVLLAYLRRNGRARLPRSSESMQSDVRFVLATGEVVHGVRLTYREGHPAAPERAN